MNDLLRKLLSFLHLGVAEGEEPQAPEAAPEEEDLFADDPLLEAAEEGGGTPAVEPEESPALKEANRRIKDAEERAEREYQARLRAEQAAPAPRGDPEFEREEAEMVQLRQQGATEEQLAWKRWQIDSNRKIRETQRSSGDALRQAQDLADKTAFERLEITKPQTFKRYAKRVEDALTDYRSKGGNPSRMLVLRLLIGDDIMEGKVKPKAKTAAVARGSSPVVRSDTRGKGGALSDHEKRKARLQNVRI